MSSALFKPDFVAPEGSPAHVGASRVILSWMPKAKSKPKTKRKKVVTPAFKRQIEQARRDLAEGKGITVGELLTKLLERDARKNAA